MSRIIIILAIVVLQSLALATTNTLNIFTGANRPDLVVYSLDESPPIMDNNTTNTVEPHRVLCAVWANGKVIVGNNKQAISPYWELSISPQLASFIVNDSISSASQLSKLSGPFPLRTAIIHWPDSSVADLARGVKIPLDELIYSQQNPLDQNVPIRTRNFDQIVQFILSNLPAPNTGVQLDVKWEF